ncbi:GTP pyrophosphokinase [Pseudomonas pharyngis]|uniref:GTP pyrophosphokinase n=1 Tax=Pseudomonas pharyngis TaxID=2892333 RepID=UPI001F448AEC|nr:hypothetical protein [Pseudomonas pharyngis]
MDTSTLKESYFQVSQQAERLKVLLTAQLEHLLKKVDISLGVPIEARVKDWQSIEDKIVRKSLSLDKLVDLDDFLGVRLILLFQKDISAVEAILNTNLNVISSEDTALRLTESQFGYQSKHFVVELPKEWLNVPSWNDLGAIRIEIQVRTLAQHIWAAVSHKLQYKKEKSVPRPLLRSINRASALLECVDVEFDRILDARELYIEQNAKEGNRDDILNVDIIETILSKHFPAQNKGPDEDLDDLLIDLHDFGIKTSGQLTDLINKHYNEIMNSDESHAFKAGSGKGFYFKHIGLAREGLRKEFGDEVISDYLKEQNYLRQQACQDE